MRYIVAIFLLAISSYGQIGGVTTVPSSASLAGLPVYTTSTNRTVVVNGTSLADTDAGMWNLVYDNGTETLTDANNQVRSTFNGAFYWLRPLISSSNISSPPWALSGDNTDITSLDLISVTLNGEQLTEWTTCPTNFASITLGGETRTNWWWRGVVNAGDAAPSGLSGGELYLSNVTVYIYNGSASVPLN